ncbi:MAG TPA: LPS export ABC transporter ATP-binding protein, partial [Chitinophagaceae bacterium]
MPLMIHTRDLVKKYGQRVVVNNVSFDVKQGEIVGLLGPNGAGKTTSFYQVVGLVKPDQGEVFLGDENITKLPMYKRAKMGIGYLPQEASVFRKLSVEDNITAVLEMTDLSKQEQKAKLESLLTEFRLHHVRKSNGDVLSGGERRRTEIARALAVDPKFILLDEPFAGIDPIAVEDIQAIVAKLKYKNIGILITDHNVTETLSICDRAYLLIEGKIFKHGTAEELAADEQVRKLYLGRNFELKRKDYLHEEARSTSTNVEIKPELLGYSIESALKMIDHILKMPVTITNISDPEGLGIKDLAVFISELKKAALRYGTSNNSEAIKKEAQNLTPPDLKRYKPNGFLFLLISYLGRGGHYVAY